MCDSELFILRCQTFHASCESRHGGDGCGGYGFFKHQQLVHLFLTGKPI